MEKSILATPNAAVPLGPYSQAVQAGNFVFISGQIALDRKTGQLVGDTIVQQTEKVLENLKSILTDIGLEPQHVVKAIIYLQSIDDCPVVNALYGKMFAVNPPARETVEVSHLPRNAKIEISAVAVCR
jgi:2-iminobutanoate/2-iminopropanoate deaminase